MLPGETCYICEPQKQKTGMPLKRHDVGVLFYKIPPFIESMDRHRMSTSSCSMWTAAPPSLSPTLQRKGEHDSMRTAHTLAGGEHVVVRLSTSPCAPMALLVGWAGCTPRQLDKYAHIYTYLGISTISATPSPRAIFSRSLSALHLFCASLLAVVRRTSGESPVVMHLFSNGGAFCLLAGLQAVGAAAIVFDSGPCYPDTRTTANAAAAVGIAAECTSVDADEFWSFMRNRPVRCPELYIFSDADSLLNARRLTALVAQRRVMASTNTSSKDADIVHVREWEVPGSYHVTVYKAFPVEYVRRVREFLEVALKRQLPLAASITYRNDETNILLQNDDTTSKTLKNTIARDCQRARL